MPQGTREVQPGRRPLRLPIEHYVHCPRGELVSVERCAGCGLLQGTLLGDRPEILCAYPETVPALRQQPPEAATHASRPRGRGMLPVGPGRPTRRAVRPSGELIFESDWPDD